MHQCILSQYPWQLQNRVHHSSCEGWVGDADFPFRSIGKVGATHQPTLRFWPQKNSCSGYLYPRCLVFIPELMAVLAPKSVCESDDSMARILRKLLFDPTEVGIYHCINR